jgi:WS/DGAT/MGAT family acyltransferase
VRRLSGQDALFLLLEMPEHPMQGIALGLLSPRTGEPFTLEDLRRHLTARLDQLPVFRCRVVPVPLGLAHPVLVEDVHFDLGKHLRHAVLPEPGGPKELDASWAHLVSQRLDRDRPLWRITLIDGLADGRQALVLEIHHALVDGFALRTTLERIFSDEVPASPLSPWQPGPMPGRARLISGALAHNAQILARLPGLVARTRRAKLAVRQRQSTAAVKVPRAVVDVPQSVINAGTTPHRRFARASLPLDEVLAVKNLAGATVNDVVLALVGGALRGFLESRGLLPDRPLVARVPVGRAEAGSTPRAEGNRVTFLHTSLATDVADPWERLQRISAVTTEAKRCLDLTGRELVDAWLTSIPPLLAAPLVRRRDAMRRGPGTRRIKLNANVSISNVRGPTVPWQLGSTVADEMYVVPPGGGVGVDFALWDYAGRLLFGIVSFTEVVEDAGELARQLSRAHEELVAAAEFRRVPTS